MKYTKGPWKAVKETQEFDGSSYCYDMEDDDDREQLEKMNFVRIVNYKNEHITTNHDLFEFRGEEGTNNARLMAAAPLMYELLKQMRFEADLHKRHSMAVDEAIGLAEGKLDPKDIVKFSKL